MKKKMEGRQPCLGNEWNHFMTILQLDPYFKTNVQIYMSILGFLVKKLLILILFSPFPPNFSENKNLRF